MLNQPKPKNGPTFNRLAVVHGQLNTISQSPSAEGRLPESLHFAESDVIVGVVRVRSVHKVVYGHNGDWAAA